MWSTEALKVFIPKSQASLDWSLVETRFPLAKFCLCPDCVYGRHTKSGFIYNLSVAEPKNVSGDHIGPPKSETLTFGAWRVKGGPEVSGKIQGLSVVGG